MLRSTTAHHNALDRIKRSEDPRQNLCDYVNRMSPDDVVFFLRYVAGWQTAEYYGKHGFRSSGDNLFDELYRDLIGE